MLSVKKYPRAADTNNASNVRGAISAILGQEAAEEIELGVTLLHGGIRHTGQRQPYH